MGEDFSSHDEDFDECMCGSIYLTKRLDATFWGDVHSLRAYNFSSVRGYILSVWACDSITSFVDKHLNLTVRMPA